MRLSLGTEFASETDTTFSHAWCYTDTMKDGLALSKLRLGFLEPKQSC